MEFLGIFHLNNIRRGGGLAGSEAAYQLAKRGVSVRLFEMRPVRDTEAHKTGSLAELQQLDWTIEYGRYRSFQGLELPVKMTARRQDVSVKLAVKDWNLSWETAPDD